MDGPTSRLSGELDTERYGTNATTACKRWHVSRTKRTRPARLEGWGSVARWCWRLVGNRGVAGGIESVDAAGAWRARQVVGRAGCRGGEASRQVEGGMAGAAEVGLVAHEVSRGSLGDLALQWGGHVA